MYNKYGTSKKITNLLDDNKINNLNLAQKTW